MPITMRRMLAVLLSCSLPFGCGGGDNPSKGEPCTQSSDCEGPQLCIDGMCRDGGETTTGADGGETTTGADGGETTTEADGGETTTGADGGETTAGGDPCELGGNVCLDENTLGVCNVADQSTMPVSCDDSCAAMGFSTAIGCNVATGEKHQCYCDQLTATCKESFCGGGNVLAECNGGVLNVRDCEQECQANGLFGECGYDQQTAAYFCNCTGPFPCVEGSTFCQDSLSEMRCTAGVWEAQLCSDEACDAEQCVDEFSNCPAGYHPQTLGCGYDSFYGDTGCLCTS